MSAPDAERGEEAPAASDAARAGETTARGDDAVRPGGQAARDDTARPDATAGRGDAGTTRDAGGGRPDATGGEAPSRDEAMARGYARSRAKTEAIQAQLQPLGPDERPLGIKLAVALAVFLAVANLVGAALGAGGESPAVGVVFAALMTGLAIGTWQRRYLVILLYQALLALTIIAFALALALASNLLGALLAVVVIGLCAPVFWLLVRVMARLQVPQE